MDVEAIHSRLRHLDPVVFNGPDGSLRVLDKSARVVCEVPADGARDQEAVATELEKVLLKVSGSGQDPPILLRVNVVAEAFDRDDIGRALANLTEFLKPEAQVQLILHFGAAPKKWDAILPVVKSLRETLRWPKELEIQAIGPFSVIGDTEMGLLGQLGVGITFAAGWIKGCDSNSSKDVDTVALRTYARFGFRVPVAWYVHAKNIAEIEDRLPNMLVANYHSGFSLPLVSSSPYYQFGDGFPSLPDALEYCQLLVRIYKRFPYFDDVLAPLNELATLVGHGGWHSQFNMPIAMQILVDSDGQVGLYRQTPAFAVPCTSISEVANSQPESLRSRFLTLAAEAWQWQRNPYCRECYWRYICGGLDVPVSHRNDKWCTDSMCVCRKLFLEHFAHLRVPDVVLKVPHQAQLR